MRISVLVLVAFGCSNAPHPTGSIRFRQAAPVWRVDDRRPLAHAPEPRSSYRILGKLDDAITRRATRAMEVRNPTRALDVNSVEEVPDSSWFTNRIGTRDLTLDELRRGPNTSESPFDQRPWTITGAKIGGRSLGFTFEDKLGRKFLLKFDEKEHPETETAAHIIVHRILWACGFNVPEDHVGYIHREDLAIGDKAREKGLDEDKLEKALHAVYQRDGEIRVLASRFVPGKVLGGYAREGVRGDDPNDTIPHERRRSIRGQHPIFAWLDHADMKEDNSVDAFDHDSVTHYLVDFGKALGVMAVSDRALATGARYAYDIPDAVKNLFSLGARTQDWETRDEPGLRGVGVFDTEHFDPAHWRPRMPYWPFYETDRADGFWGAKLLMRFRPHELAAIVEEAKLTDPRAAKYLVETLVKRQRMVARYWFDRIAPLDDFRVTDGRLCFTDLLLAHLLRTTRTSYAIDTFDYEGHRLPYATTLEPSNGRACAPVSPSGYTIFRIRVQRDGAPMPPVVVHVANSQVIGLRRR